MATTFPDPRRIEEAEEAVRAMHRSMAALGEAAAAVKLPVSPQMARGVQATENAWREMEAEFGLLSGAEVARLAGSSARNATGFANDRRNAGKLLGIRRKNAYLYPGFQFDGTGHVLPIVLRLIAEAHLLEVNHETLAQWFCIGSATLDGKRPVDALDDEDGLLESFRASFGVEW